MISFRNLTASDIDCRISIVKESGVSLLLYKDARCDMNILDETVGPDNWQRSHEVINGNMFCNVGIRINDEWVWKQDVGAESYPEKEKGPASDSFKRACFNWGIGRELYTAPFIWIEAKDCKIEPNPKNPDGFICKDRFNVEDFEVVNKRITYLTIERKGKRVFEWGDRLLSRAQIKTLEKCIPMHGQTVEKTCEVYRVKELGELTTSQFIDIMHRMGEDS